MLFLKEKEQKDLEGRIVDTMRSLGSRLTKKEILALAQKIEVSKGLDELRKSLESEAKLSKELSRRDTGNTLYILDEPTTGLHFHDIEALLRVLHRLRDDGNTVVVIEHNLDVIKTADWVVDMGPEGGHRGGMLIAEGTPEDIAANPASHTGRFLAPLLKD